MSRSTGTVLAFLLGVASASAFAETPAAIPSASRPFIEVNPGSITAFRERGGHRPFVAVGVNYFDPETGWAPKLWQQYDESRVRRHLRLIHDQGSSSESQSRIIAAATVAMMSRSMITKPQATQFLR